MPQTELTPEQITMLKEIVELNEHTKILVERILEATFMGDQQWCPPACE